MVEQQSGTQKVEVRKNVEYAVHDGQTLQGHLYSPQAPGKYPAVIAVHGGGWKNPSRENYQFLGPWLAERGYVVFAASYRLAKAGQKSFPEAVQDVRAAVQFIKGKAPEFKADPERVGLMGDSAGGNLATLVALAGEHPLFKDGNKGDAYGNLSTEVKVMVPVYGIFDLARQWEHDQISRPRDHLVETFLGTSLIENRRVFFDASPLSYVSVHNNATAFLVAWGSADDIADPVTQSESFLEALKQANHFVRSVVVDGAPHYWISEPLDELGSYPAFFAPRLLRFLQTRL